MKPQVTGRPLVVTLCGSTKYADWFRLKNLELTLAGEIVLSIGCDLRSDDDLAVAGELNDIESTKRMLDELHKRKIDLCDYVLVLNVGGYIGRSTMSEMLYASAHHKPIEFLEPLPEMRRHNHMTGEHPATCPVCRMNRSHR